MENHNPDISLRHFRAIMSKTFRIFAVLLNSSMLLEYTLRIPFSLIMKKTDSNCLMGIILPLSEVSMGMLLSCHEGYSRKLCIVLDENGRLWLVKTEIIQNAKDMEPFCLAVIRFDDKLSITDAYAAQEHTLCISCLSDISKEDIENVNFKYNSLTVNDIATHSSITGSVKIVNYLDETGSCITSRSFFIDKRNQVYHELSCEFTTFLKERTKNKRNDISDYLHFYPLEIERVYELVQNFNPYQVFESYKIEIIYEIEDNDKRGHYKPYQEFYKYKKYSISYIDDYLANWFYIGKKQLYYERFITGDFKEEMCGYGSRFIEEENEAIEKAYAEYNQYEHFECLMQEHYRYINEHISKIKKQKPEYPQYNWLTSAMNIRGIYHFIGTKCSQMNWRAFRPAYAPIIEVLSEAIEEYNKTQVNKQ